MDEESANKSNDDPSTQLHDMQDVKWDLLDNYMLKRYVYVEEE